MAIYTQFAAWGLPCPITGHPNSGRFAGEQQQGQQGGAQPPPQQQQGGVRAAM
jgi:hypothetical protein